MADLSQFEDVPFTLGQDSHEEKGKFLELCLMCLSVGLLVLLVVFLKGYWQYLTESKTKRALASVLANSSSTRITAQAPKKKKES